jgi:hypothetical protein
MEMTAVWKERKSKSPFPLFPHCLGKLAKTASFPHSHSLGGDLGFPFSPSSFNFNFNEKCYLLARYLLLPTSPFAQFLHIWELRIGRRKTFCRIWINDSLGCASPGLLVRGSGFSNPRERSSI